MDTAEIVRLSAEQSDKAMAWQMASTGPRPLRVLSIDDLEAFPPRTFLLTGLIAEQEISVWWGAPKCGKSFLLMRLAFGLSLGIGMWGLKARPCRTLYVMAEGRGGARNRFGALLREMGNPGSQFAVIAQQVVIGAPYLDLEALISAAKAHRTDIVIVDTLARTFGEGDENSTIDMNSFVAALDKLRVEAGVHVAVIHHGGKSDNPQSPRGSSVLMGAADMVVKVTKGANGAPHQATITAAKDDAEDGVYPFTLRAMDLGTEKDGRPRTTLIADEAEPGTLTPSRPSNQLSGAKDMALRVLVDCLNTSGSMAAPGVPSGGLSVSRLDWRREYLSRADPGATEEARDKGFRRSAADLVKLGAVACANGRVWKVWA
jgi:hypothetical protein